MDELTSTPTFHDTPDMPHVAAMQHQLHYSQAVRVPAGLDRIELSGQGGWDDDLAFPADLGEEVARAFDNLEAVLGEAGATWSDVVSVDSFHVASDPASIGDEHTGAMVAQLSARMPGHRPIWTQVGVTVLGAVGMRVEVRVTALVAPTRP